MKASELFPGAVENYGRQYMNPTLVDFLSTMQEKPHLYPAVRKCCLYFLRNRGYKYFSMEFALSVLRWSPEWEKIGRLEGDDFAIKNAHRSYLTRLFLYEFPEFRSKFRMTKSDADAVPNEVWAKALSNGR